MTKKMCPVFGIDLGTTNSCIAVLEEGIPRVIPVDGKGIVPSVVSLEGETLLVGERAKNRAAAFPEQSLRSVKRCMGGQEKLCLGDRKHSPEEISAMILRYLCHEAERLEGVPVKQVVITVPAYFSDAQRRATLEAGTLAGLEVERIINEPTAAALFYDHVDVGGGKEEAKASGEEYVLVYDLGGGTFDVSVLRTGEIVEVLASTGDTHLGGDDFDQCLVELLQETILEQNGTDLQNYPPALARLAAAAEEAKIRLSSKANTLIQENHIPTPEGGTCSVSLEISREYFEGITRHLLEKTRTLTFQALKEANLHKECIKKVLLVGGMTRMPGVSDLVAEIFQDAPLPVVDPDRSVAHGAAIQGGMITGDYCEQILIDVTPHTLSVAALDTDTHDIFCAPIIPRNTQLPVTRARTFATVCDNQRRVEIDVYQGEFHFPQENTLLGGTLLSLAKAPANSPVVVEYSYDLDGIVHITAEQKGFSRKIELSLDSRNPGEILEQDMEELDEEMEAEIMESSEEMFNFILVRARKFLEKLPEEKRKDLVVLLDNYEEALKEDADNLDDLEDELLLFMEENE
jgi:molecular chaperone DnaK